MSVKVTGRLTCEETGRGLPDVLVSNGEHVVKTDAGGTYELTAEPGVHRFVWVTQPAGHRTETWFHPLPEADDEVHFHLTPAPERGASSFHFVQITDTHVSEERTPSGIYRQAIHDIVEQVEPAFILHCGDLTNRGTMEELESYRSTISGIQTPIFSLFGNHDGYTNRIEADGADTTHTTNFNELLGPAYYSFDWGAVHVCLHADIDKYLSDADCKRRNDWLRADLGAQPADRPTVLAIHVPPPDEFVDEMNQLGVAVILCGHLHANKAYAYRGTSVLATATFCFGGIDTSPRCYRVLHVSNQTIVGDWRASQVPRLQPCEPGSLRVGDRCLELMWSAELPGDLHRAGPVVSGDRIFVSLRDEDLAGGPGVACIDAANGEILWESATDAAVKNRVALDDDGHCAALGVSGRLTMLDAGSGRIRWRRELPDYPQRWLFSSPVIDGDLVCGGARGGYGAWHVDTGEPVWYTELDGVDKHACFAVPVLHDGLLINVVQSSGAVAMQRDTGEIVWRREEQSVNYMAGGPILAHGDRVIMPGEGGQVLCLRAESGEEIWHIEPDSGVVTGLTACGEHALLSTEAAGALCIRVDTGEQVWRGMEPSLDLMDATAYHAGDATLLAAPVCWEGYALIGANDGVLYVLDASSGDCAAQLFVGAPITAAPCVLADGFCVPTWDGRLLRYAVSRAFGDRQV